MSKLSLFSIISLALVSILFSSCNVRTLTVNVSNSDVFSTNPQMSNNQYFLTWVEGDRVFLSRKEPETSAPFTTPTDLGEATGSTILTKPQIAVYGSNVYVVWRNETEVVTVVSNDGGAFFGSPIPVSDTSSTGYGWPSVHAMRDNVFILWKELDSAGLTSSVYFRRSTDAGQSFDDPITILSDTASSQARPVMAVYMDYIYVIWCEMNNSLVLRKSSDAGAEFDPPQILSSDTSSSCEERILVSYNYIYVIWNENVGGGDVFARASSDNGANFGDAFNVSQSSGVSNRGQITGSREYAMVVWVDDSEGHEDIYFSRSTDAGAAFSTPMNLSHSLGTEASLYPQVSGSSRYVHVVWQQDSGEGTYEIFRTYSQNTGESFIGSPRLIEGPMSDIDPGIISSGVDRYIVWESGNTIKSDILYYSLRKWRLTD